MTRADKEILFEMQGKLYIYLALSWNEQYLHPNIL